MANRRPAPSSACMLALACLACGLLAALPARGQDGAAARVDRRALYGDGAPVLGNPRGDTTIVVFLDYQCPYCRALHPDLMRIVAEDGRIRLIVKDWPILSPFSVVAARSALAARYQGRHAEVHDALMRAGGRLDQETIDKALAAARVDPGRLAADLSAHRAEIDRVLSRNAALAEGIGLAGTPAIVVGPFLFPGGLSAADLRKAVAAAREKAGKRG